MADAAAAEVQAETPPAPARPLDRIQQRAERRAVAIARLQQSGASAGSTAQVAAPPAEAPKPAAPVETAKPAETAPALKPTEPEKPDPATERGLRSIEQARKKFLDEQKAEKAELEVQRAEVARLRKEAEGKVTSAADLKKLRGHDLADRLDHFKDEDWLALSRAAYARTEAGKSDPRAQEAVRDAGERVQAATLRAELEQMRADHKAELEQIKSEFTRRDHASFAERWLGEAVKGIPSDKPTFLAKLYANEPDTARRELLTIGSELEKANDGQAPTQAEVIEEFEKRRRASLKAMGLDPDALLAPPKPAPTPAPKPAARTLNVAASNLTRVENAPKTRDERREIAIANLKARRRTTADEQP